MIRRSFILVFAVFLLAGVAFIFAQPAFSATKEERIDSLRQQIEELTRQAALYRGNVLNKQEEADTLEREISILSNRINGLQAEINLTSNQIETTEIEIVDLENQIFDTSQVIDQHKNAISELMATIYERDQMGIVSILLSNQRLSDFANEAQQIEELNSQLYDIVTELKDRKALNENRRELYSGILR